MDYKYANLLTVLFVTMMYGSGIPILYPISVIFFIATYWCDKLLIFNYYKKPELLDESLALKTLAWFKYALVLHVIGAVYMYSNSNILPDKNEMTNNKLGKKIQQYVHSHIWTKVNSLHISIYLGVCMAILALYLVWKILIKTIYQFILNNCRGIKKLFGNTAVHDDYYQCIGFVDLKISIDETRSDLKKINKNSAQF